MNTKSNITKHIKSALILENGTIFEGYSIGKRGTTVGEVCFNTAMTGYQEAISDPSYAGQILTFTFPHIGITGANNIDIESKTPYLRGIIFKTFPFEESNWRASFSINEWLKSKNIIGLCGIDTRRLTMLIREEGAPKGVITSSYTNSCNLNKYVRKANKWKGLTGMDLALSVTCKEPYIFKNEFENDIPIKRNTPKMTGSIVVIDYGCKTNILRLLFRQGFKIIVVPADYSAENILKYKPDGVFLSNGPGDPEATSKYAAPIIRKLINKKIPMFGICLGHQILSISLGAKTKKMHHGHHGINQPVKNLKNNRVEITSQNHGFVVDRNSLPDNIIETHTSLFDNVIEGIKIKNRPIFSVQFHPEASPGPHDSNYLFEHFTKNILKNKSKKNA